MKPCPNRGAAHGPLKSMSCRFAGPGVTTRHPGGAWCAAEAVFAALRLPCAARVRGPVAQLATLTAFAALEQARRVRSRSALCARAPHPVLLGASEARHAPPGCRVAQPLVACEAAHCDPGAGKAASGAWAGRIGAAEQHRDPGRARSALRDLTRCRCLSAESEANAASSATGPGARAAQGTRSAAKGKPSEPGPGRARRLALADASVRERTFANRYKGPRAARHRSASCVVVRATSGGAIDMNPQPGVWGPDRAPWAWGEAWS